LTKTLVIVESPAKAKSLTKMLDRKYTVLASMGHVRDLPKSQFGVDVQHDFAPKYITIRGKGDVIKELRTAVKKADQVLLASDPDREGEAIAWHLKELLDLPERDLRVAFNEITGPAVQKAIASPRPIDLNLVNAQQARRILDRLVGYNLSPLLWRKVRKGLSAGRVQSVALRLICDREEEIRKFVATEYWDLTARLKKAGQPGFPAILKRLRGKTIQLTGEKRVKQVLADLTGVRYQVKKVTTRESVRWPSPPFTTSSLQQEANRKLNFTSRRTMLVAQQLYEGLDVGAEGILGLVTYIRTDSTRVGESAQAAAREYIMETFGAPFVPDKVRQIKGKGKIQDAHEAIRPTSVRRDPESVKQYLSAEQYRLYRLIWLRFLASQMSPALVDVTAADIGAGDYTFRASGQAVRFPGYTKVYTEGRDDGDKEEEEGGRLPRLSEGDLLELKALDPEQHFTQPPPRYSEATLIKSMEEKGIGRPSTYAPTLDTILKRGYALREKKHLLPTELGMLVIDLLKEHFPSIVNLEFTAQMEERLDGIGEGENDWVQVLDQFYGPFQKTLEEAEAQIGEVKIADEESDETCDLCGRRLVYKMGRYGRFLACPGFPECRFTKALTVPAGVPCPKCGAPLLIRRSRKGRKFYGCAGYPQCDFVTWDMPTSQRCTACGGILVQKKRGPRSYLACINEECPERTKRAGKERKKKSAPAGRTGVEAGLG
jgi:DNA topoisomerase-1